MDLDATKVVKYMSFDLKDFVSSSIEKAKFIQIAFEHSPKILSKVIVWKNIQEYECFYVKSKRNASSKSGFN
jgi:hypothetical protein